MYIKDLSEYQNISNVLAIGWLDEKHKFPLGNVSEFFLNRIKELNDTPTFRTRSFHTCPFCSQASGSAEVWLSGASDQIFVFPTLLHHYVEKHGYVPPAPFLAALNDGTALSFRKAQNERLQRRTENTRNLERIYDDIK